MNGSTGLQKAPLSARAPNFRGSAIRLVKLLAPQRWKCLTVVVLGVAGVGIGAVVPRVLGHATDLLFNGMIGRRLSAAITKAQAVADARARGDRAFADLLSGMNVTPGRGVDFGAVSATLVLALCLYGVAALLLWAQARLLNVIVQRAMVQLRGAVGEKMHRLPLSYFDGQQRGEILSRITNDIDNLQSSLSLTVSQLVTSVLTVAAVLAMMMSLSPLLASLTLLIVPLLLLGIRAITHRSQRLFVAHWASMGRLNAHVEEIYSGFTVVKTFGHQAAATQRFRQLNDAVYQTGFGAQCVSGLVTPFTAFLGNIGYVTVAVLGGLQVATGQLTLGNLQAFIQYVRQLTTPLSQLAAMYNTLQSGVASAERVFTVLDEAEEPSDPALNGTRTLDAPLAGRVEFQHVNFAYHPGAPVIQDLSLVVEPGSAVAIVGPTGVGKTTLVNLLLRFYEIDSGRILIDGIDISSVNRQALRSRIGMVLQDSWLFEGTIAENIRYGRPEASEEEVVAAAEAAYVDRFVHTLPAGYQTPVTGDGGNISAGEKQLITIARAFLTKPQLLILDEATSSVDTRTEALIQQAICRLCRGRTSFVIAHRLSTIRDADQILVMEAGKIIEQGSHAELLAQCGAYYRMVQVQQAQGSQR